MKNYLWPFGQIALPSVSRSYFGRRRSLPYKACLNAIRFALIVTLLALPGAISFAQSAQKPLAGAGIKAVDPKLEARVESLLQKMTLEEKIGQLVQYSA